VLAVDDEPWLLDLYCLVLTSVLGVRVLTATDSAEALRLLGMAPVDLVISDVNRPQMNGLAFTRRVRRLHPRMPVLVFSGAYDGCLLAAAQAAGASVCLPRPFRFQQLVRLVRRALSRRRRGRCRAAASAVRRPRS